MHRCNAPRSGLLAALFVLSLGAWACSDPPVSAGNGSGGQDAGSDAGGDAASDATADVFRFQDVGTGGFEDVPDVPDTAADASPDDVTDAKTDTFEWPDEDADIGPPPDVAKPDVTYKALQVVATTPANDGQTTGTLAKFTVQFDQPLEPITVGTFTVQVLGAGSGTLNGTFNVSGDTFTFEADAKVLPATRVDVEISTLVTGPQGQTLEQPYSFHFQTPGHADTAPYAAMAARYAPIIDVALAEGGDAAWDIPRWPGDFVDPAAASGAAGYWALNDAPALAQAQKALPRVGWGVVETQSHVFLHYLVYWPKRVAEAGNPGFVNDTALFTVVVARWPSEHPVALRTWSKRKDDERMWLWLTDDAALLPSGAKPSQHGVRGVLAAKQLFPTTEDVFGCDSASNCKPRRAPVWVRGGVHQACLRGDAGETSGGKHCFWDANVARVRLVPGATAEEVPFSSAVKGAEPKSYGYTLEPLETTFWSRRVATDLFEGPLSFSYSAPAGRPKGVAGNVGSKFVGGGASDFGRPPWAIRWKPASNETYYDLPRGTVFLDPAYALWKRMGAEAAKLPAFDKAKGVGLSVALCFDPFLYVDERGASACQP
ncbi:MAG: hypothetical protein RIT45_1146 [Pseudomonadota bacterium]